jgi:FkbM family methyltransferase
MLAVLGVWFRIHPEVVCRRAGITYSLDRRELIDRDVFLGAWERSTSRFIRQCVKPGAVVLEVGANIGAHTLLLAQRVGPAGRVHAFEPTDFARTKLDRNVALNPELAPRISVINALVTDNRHSVPSREIRSSWRLHGPAQAPVGQVTSEAVSLDEYASACGLERVDVLKIDVDGYDFKVLRGAIGLLGRWHPLIYIELCEYALRNQGDSVAAIFELLAPLGYAARGEDGAALTGPDQVLRLIGNSSSINALFVALKRSRDPGS